MSPCHLAGFIERLSIELRRDDWSLFAIKGDGVAGERARGDAGAAVRTRERGERSILLCVR
jgi:hypothetical protein